MAERPLFQPYCLIRGSLTACLYKQQKVAGSGSQRGILAELLQIDYPSEKWNGITCCLKVKLKILWCTCTVTFAKSGSPASSTADSTVKNTYTATKSTSTASNSAAKGISTATNTADSTIVKSTYTATSTATNTATSNAVSLLWQLCSDPVYNQLLSPQGLEQLQRVQAELVEAVRELNKTQKRYWQMGRITDVARGKAADAQARWGGPGTCVLSVTW